MGFLFEKKKGARQYLYWGESARLKGQPRLVQQIYLGPKDRVLQELKLAYTRGRTPGRCPLKKLRHKEFAASALLYHWADQLGLVALIDRHVPAVEPQRRTPLSVGQYLVIAAINRALWACSKRALFRDWYQHSVLSRLWPAAQGELSSQRFWDHMDQVQPAHIEQIQLDLLPRLQQRFALEGDTLLYDTTNYFTFLDTFNERSQLAQRGHNKQKRADLRQLSLALFEDQHTGLPLYHRCYAGHRPDVSSFNESWQGLLRGWMKGLQRPAQQLTLVFDQGNTSKHNLRALQQAALHYVGAIPGRWVADLLEVPLERYEPLPVPGSKHVKAYRCRRPLWDKERTLLIVFSPTLYRKQRAAMNRLQLTVENRLQQLSQAILRWARTGRGKGYQLTSVQNKIQRWSRRDHLHQFLHFDVKTEQEKVLELSWHWDRAQKRAVQRRYLGKSVLFTEHHEWDSVQILSAYRRLAKTEQLFRLSKGRRGPWWPMYHWTDSKVRVHALYCYFALLLMAIVQLQLRQAGISMQVDRCLQSLRHIQETFVVYTNGAAQRILSEMDDEQLTLAQTLGIIDLAKQLGTTVLEAQ